MGLLNDIIDGNFFEMLVIEEPEKQEDVDNG